MSCPKVSIGAPSISLLNITIILSNFSEILPLLRVNEAVLVLLGVIDSKGPQQELLLHLLGYQAKKT